MKKQQEYTEIHAKSGIETKLPPIYTFPNHYKKYDVEITTDEFTSICPKTGLPDFGKIKLIYRPNKSCIELKSFKMYLLGYRNVGIFNENLVNRILDDIVKECNPVWAQVVGEFTSRGGLKTSVTAKYPRK
ncbi:NADPH-dependent 7-cyano-7-deazaguanine reductase QueF [candidate division WOR-1 bacterium RIFOXYC2_FULL_37_10]|nr:MAG: NADPH-dependent 7-cyano-7-deazaguanine reductase QueF [candidate division WOR-1 bacterium RIFOXYA2_FULL_37_7]OGC33611.1 MAG: NADPH-dependent 7-cyano-7-deazaguanine reductase QueF [candidate division WOR-1 bacterium RIFOXYC2_FULL_37_10]